MSGLDPEHRRHVLEAVAVWLDELAEAEPPVPGVAPEAVQSAEPVPDLFTMLGQLTALTRETQLQGRATNRLHAELSAKLDHLAENQSSADTMARKLGDVRPASRSSRKCWKCGIVSAAVWKKRNVALPGCAGSGHGSPNARCSRP